MSESPAADAAVAAALNGGVEDPGPGPEDQLDDQDAPENEGLEPTALEDLPQDWQDEIKRLRRENATARVKSREAARKTTGAQQPPEATSQALKAAEERGRQSALMESGIRLAGAEVKAALATVLPEDQIVDAIEDLDLTRFVDDSGDVDSDAVAAYRDKVSKLVGKRTTPSVNHGRQAPVKPAKSTADAFAEAVGAALQ